MSGARRLGLAGFFAIAVAFGPARNGYGLFLPYFNQEFELTTEISGFIASGLYAGYLFALSAVGLLAARVGPRPLVLIGGSAAALGMALVALAPNAYTLAAGVVLAGTSAGWSWAPYNDAVDRAVPPRHRDRVLSIVSTGTTFGILAAGLVALAAGADWRAAWFAFAAGAVAAAVLNATVLPGGPGGSAEGKSSLRRLGRAWLLRVESVPLLVVAFSFGVISAFYFSFAVDLVARSGGFSLTSTGPVLFAFIGAAGFVGLLTGDAVSRFGLRRVLLITLAFLGVAAFLMGVAPSSWPAVAVSASFFGAGVMLMSALLSVWSSAVFPEQPSTGFSATLFVFGVGLVVGPAALGTLAGRFGLEAAFLATAALALLTMLAQPTFRKHPDTVEPSSEVISKDPRRDKSKADRGGK